MILNIKNFNVFLISLGFFLSQFYVFGSGLPQPAHIFIFISILSFFLVKNKIDVKEVKILFYFFIYIVCINLFFTFYRIVELSYIVSILYWVFNLTLFLVLVNLNKDSVQKLFFYFKIIIPFSLILNILFWVVGAGRYNFSPRYNGYFNDPNQMAFWVLCVCAMGLILFNKFSHKILVYFISVFLILLTMSRSATLGLFVLTVGLIIQHKGRLDFKILISLISLFVVIALFFISLNFGFLDSMVTRFSEGAEQNQEQASSRGFDILLYYPEYLLFGAGQGAYYLFSSTHNEIHSTWLGILFYYGIIGFLIFIYFIYKIFRKIRFPEKFIFLAPMIYGFFTYNARTLVFWFLVAIFLLYSKYRDQE